jgi:hypothetical protein
MVRFLLRSSGLLLPSSVMVLPARLRSKWIVSPLVAAAIMPRSDPSPDTPVSLMLVTNRLLGTVRVSSHSRVSRDVRVVLGAGRRRRKSRRTSQGVKRVRNAMERFLFPWSGRRKYHDDERPLGYAGHHRWLATSLADAVEVGRSVVATCTSVKLGNLVDQV